MFAEEVTVHKFVTLPWVEDTGVAINVVKEENKIASSIMLAISMYVLVVMK